MSNFIKTKTKKKKCKKRMVLLSLFLSLIGCDTKNDFSFFAGDPIGVEYVCIKSCDNDPQTLCSFDKLLFKYHADNMNVNLKLNSWDLIGEYKTNLEEFSAYTKDVMCEGAFAGDDKLFLDCSYTAKTHLPEVTIVVCPIAVFRPNYGIEEEDDDEI